jgi:hypothetical protein
MPLSCMCIIVAWTTQSTRIGCSLLLPNLPRDQTMPLDQWMKDQIRKKELDSPRLSLLERKKFCGKF